MICLAQKGPFRHVRVFAAISYFRISVSVTVFAQMMPQDINDSHDFFSEMKEIRDKH